MDKSSNQSLSDKEVQSYGDSIKDTMSTELNLMLGLKTWT